MIKFNPMNGNILIRFPKKYDELETSSGIILPLVEQDINVAEVVSVPENKTYIMTAREDDGTYIRNEDGSVKEVVGHVWVEPGDKVILEKKKHADYDIRQRNVTDRTFFLDEYTRQMNDDYEYYITKSEDILVAVEGDIPRSNDVHGYLFSQIPPKPVYRKPDASD